MTLKDNITQKKKKKIQVEKIFAFGQEICLFVITLSPLLG